MASQAADDGEQDNAPCVQSGLDLILVGRTGNGKSATGNHVLGKYYFEEGCGTASQTKKASAGSNDIDGRTIMVCDTAGLCDTALEKEEAQEQLVVDSFIDGLNLFPEGFHAVIIVLQVGSRMTKEELGALRQIEQLLGGHVLKKYGVIVFTGGDSFKGRTKGTVTFQEWCRQQEGQVKEIFKACDYRCVLFNNITEDEGILKRQRSELVAVIDKLETNGKRYTSVVFEALHAEWKRAKEAGRQPEIARQIYLAMGRLGADLNQIVLTKKYDKEVTAKLREELTRIEELNSKLDRSTSNQMLVQIKQFHDILDELDMSGVGKYAKENALPFVGTYVLPMIVSMLLGPEIAVFRFAVLAIQGLRAACRLM